MDEKVEVRFGRLYERYVGKSIRGAVQVDRLILHAALRFRFPLLEPGMALSLQAVEIDSHVRQAATTTKAITTKLLDSLQAEIPTYEPGKVNYDDPTPPRIAFSQSQNTVFIDTYVYVTPKSWKDNAPTDNQLLQSTIISLLSKQGLDTTFYTED